MSARPGTVFQWDTNNTHLIPQTAGHTTDGFSHDEVPASDEFNGILGLVGQWIKYVADGDISLNSLVVATDVTASGLILKGRKSLALAAGNTNNLDIDGVTHNVGALYIDISWSGSTSPSSARGITGIANPTDGRVLILHNKEPQVPVGAYDSRRVALFHDHASSTAGSRFWMPNASIGLSVGGTPGFVIPPDGEVVLRYDANYVNAATGETGFWMVIATNFKLAGGYKVMPVPLVPGSGTFVASQYFATAPYGNSHVGSDGSAATWKIWSGDMQGLEPGDTVIGLNVLALMQFPTLNITLLEKTTSGSSTFIINSVGTVNAGAALSLAGASQLFRITGLTWHIGADATYFVQVDGTDGNVLGFPEHVYTLQFLVAKQNG